MNLEYDTFNQYKMNRQFRKYEFSSEEEYQSALETLGVSVDEEGNSYPTHNHFVVAIGNIVKVPAVYNEEGEIVSDAVLSDKYAVDVLWNTKADASWNQYIVWPNPVGLHTFGSKSAAEYAKAYCEANPEAAYCNPVIDNVE
jgi:hypothetical protein